MMFKHVGFGRQLSIVFSAGILALALATTVVVSHISTQAMGERIVQEGFKLTEELAERSALPLLYGSEESAAEAAQLLEAFEDVAGIAILHSDQSPLYLQGVVNDQYHHLNVSHSEVQEVFADRDVWVFSAPVRMAEIAYAESFEEADQRDETVGFVRVVVSKQTLQEMATSIFLYNLVVSIGFSIVLLIFLLAITRRLVNPIHHLARVMSAARQGQQVKYVAVRGPADIKEMFEAFNSMLEILNHRENELQRSRDEAYKLARAKGEFAANVSHELRTPMNGVLGMLEMLQDSGLTGKDREYLSVAKNSAKSLLLLINDILDFSKMEAGKTILESEQFDLYGQLEEVVALLSTESQKKKINLCYELSHRLPRSYLGDSTRLRQLLMNLISNAIKFTDSGSVMVSIAKVGDEESNDGKSRLRFEVRDTGIGIDPSKVAHIFEAFSQADGSTTRKFGGTGLGLSICRQVVEVMGGEIGVESEPGVGSCFWFEISLEDADHVLVDQEVTEGFSNLNVLAVQTDDAVYRGLANMFRRGGGSCLQAATMEEAKDMFHSAIEQNQAFDLVILDQEASGELTTDYIHHFKDIRDTTVCVVLSFTTKDFDIDGSHCVYLSKPVMYSNLNMVLKSAFGSVNDLEHSLSGLQGLHCLPEIIFPSAKILVVDDNPVNQLVAIGLLEPFECDIDTAINGIECLSMVNKKTYDLILMDCNMPEMDGYKASQQIRAKESSGVHVVIVAITANAGPGDRQRCIASGMDDYLVKPFTREDLKAKFSRWLPYHRACKLREETKS